MKPHFYKILFGIVLLVVLVLSCFTLKVLLEKEGGNNRELESLKSEQLGFDYYVRQIVLESIANNGLLVDLPQRTGNEEPILVMRYSAFNCSSCVTFCADKLSEMFEDYKNNGNLLLVQSDFPANSKTLYGNSIDLGKSKLELPLEKSNLPYFFLLTGNRVDHVFVPDDRFPEYTDTYLNEIKARYFSTE